MTLEKKIKAVVIPAVQIITGHTVVGTKIRRDGATSYCTVTLDDKTRRYYKVEDTIEVTPTDKNWKRL